MGATNLCFLPLYRLLYVIALNQIEGKKFKTMTTMSIQHAPGKEINWILYCVRWVKFQRDIVLFCIKMKRLYRSYED